MYLFILTVIGFGQYLQEVDLQQQSPKYHLERTIIYCSVYFKHRIDTSILKDTVYGTIAKDLPFTRTEEEYYLLLNELESRVPDAKGIYNLFMFDNAFQTCFKCILNTFQMCFKYIFNVF